jgi:CDP-diacylglycerol--glycerol-3-phosphate 3-phosphatidyltransferase
MSSLPAKSSKTISIKLVRPFISGLALHITRLIFLIGTFALIVTEHRYSATFTLLAVLLIGLWINFRSKEFYDEKPYAILSLRILDMAIVSALLGAFLWYELKTTHSWPLTLTVMAVFYWLRTVVFPFFAVSQIRADKRTPNKTSFWTRAARTSTTIALISLTLNLGHYQEIIIGTAAMALFGSALSFIYKFYRDPDHRIPLSIASQITVSRVALTPIFILVFFYDNDLDYSNNNVIFKGLALFLILTFMFTDYLDGYLARRMGDVSTLGKFLDPFSDKISNFTVFLCFMSTGYANIWMVAIIYFREASVETLRTLAASQNMIIAARPSGKYKTAIQGIGIGLILFIALVDSIYHLGDIWTLEAPKYIMGLIAFVTVLSGVDYFISSKDVLKKYL